MGTVGSTLSSLAGSGIDVLGTVNQLIALESAPIRLLQSQQQKLSAQTSALHELNKLLLDLKAKADALKDLSGKFNTQIAASSHPDILTATASATARSGSHSVVVNSLATTSSYYTEALTDGSTPFATGTFDVSIGGGAAVTITVDSTNNTLEGLAAAINALDAGITASVVTDANGARLSLVSNTSGAPGDLTISNNTTGLSFTKAVAGANASLIVDGIPISSASNTLGTVLPGVTLNIIAPAAGTTVALSVTPDRAEARGAIEEFIASYNALVQAVNAQFSYNAETQQGAPLAGDSSLRLVQQQILSLASYSVAGNNGMETLASLGITVSNDGTLSADSAKLDDALSSNFASVQNFFQSLTPAGFARNFSTALAVLTDSVNGPLHIALKGIEQSNSSLADQIEALEDRLEVRRQILIDQFTRVDGALRQLPTLLGQISAQLNALPGVS
ncbi:MAG TPA: flagellar filament capping protein FliD [Terriglobia bacterium]|nr:flagellar filament capping protein FliD [Terriglobia bacterium]